MRVTLLPAIAMLVALVAATASGQGVPGPVTTEDPGTADGTPPAEAIETGKGGPDLDATPPRVPGGGGLLPSINLEIGDKDGTGLSTAIKIVLLLTVLTIAPGLVITLTSFTRIIIVLSFIRRALALQTLPPNQVLIGLAIFLTLAVMFPVFSDLKEQAFDPLQEDEIGAGEAADIAAKRLSKFLIAQTREEDVALFLEVASAERPETPEDVPFQVLVPSFILSELRTAFQMGFLIFLPFLIIDLVIAGILLSMGMFMLPPTIISTPFKIILFVLVDGWNLVVHSLFASFVGVG